MLVKTVFEKSTTECIFSVFIIFNYVYRTHIIVFSFKIQNKKNDTKRILKFEIQQLQNTIFIFIFILRK